MNTKMRSLLIGDKIPKPIIHYDFADISNNSCPNKGSLENADLNIVIPSNLNSYERKRYVFRVPSGGSTDFQIVEKGVDFITFTRVARRAAWVYPSLLNTNKSSVFGVQVISNNLNAYCNVIKTEGSINLGTIQQFKVGWNLVFYDPTEWAIESGQNIVWSMYTNIGDYITIKQTPIFPDIFVTSTSIYGQVNSPFRFVRDAGFSTISVRKPCKNGELTTTWSKDDNQTRTIFESGTIGSSISSSSFGSQNNLINDYEQSSISWANSTSYNDVPINKGNTADTTDLKLRVGALVDNLLGSVGARNSYQRELFIWNRDIKPEQIKDYISKNVLPLPEVYYDLSKQLTKNTDTVKSIVDLSGNGHYGELNNFTYTDPVKTQPILNKTTNSSGANFDVDILDTGIYKINGNNGNYTSILDRLNSSFNAWNSTFNVCVYGLDDSDSLRLTYQDELHSIDLHNGVNTITLGDRPTTDNDHYKWIRIVGNLTKYPIYIALMPFEDNKNSDGFGYQELPDLMTWSTSVDILGANKVKIPESFDYSWWYSTNTTPIYKDSEIAVFHPFKAVFKTEPGIKFGADYHQDSSTNIIDSQVSQFTTDENGIITVDYPGGIYVSNGTGYTAYLKWFFNRVNITVEQLPVNYDFIQGNRLNINDTTDYAYIQIMNSDKSVNTTPFKTYIVEAQLPNKLEYLQVANYLTSTKLIDGNESTDVGISQAIDENNIAFTYRNVDGKTYLNSKLNETILDTDLLGQKLSIAITNPRVNQDIIGNYLLANKKGGQTNIKLYKFLAFKEELSPEQIQLALKRYNFTIEE